MPYVLLCISIVSEVFGTTMMKLSEGFTVLAPSIGVIVAYVVSFSLFVIVLKTVPLGLAYGIWGGAGTVLTTVIGCVVWGEPFSLYTGLGIALVVMGIYLMNASSQQESEGQKVEADKAV
ncbi:MAG: multidrug efflux SMR transporter [Slackia sp.]|nr:multidrug efflux SMR transporter [Slackia sp.]